jgi:hypothetical protein
MLKYLYLKDVGLAPALRVDWAPRINLIAGDNGLGKNFLLDLAWWALTRTWAGPVASAGVRSAGDPFRPRWLVETGVIGTAVGRPLDLSHISEKSRHA